MAALARPARSPSCIRFRLSQDAHSAALFPLLLFFSLRAAIRFLFQIRDERCSLPRVAHVAESDRGLRTDSGCSRSVRAHRHSGLSSGQQRAARVDLATCAPRLQLLWPRAMIIRRAPHRFSADDRLRLCVSSCLCSSCRPSAARPWPTRRRRACSSCRWRRAARRSRERRSESQSHREISPQLQDPPTPPSCPAAQPPALVQNFFPAPASRFLLALETSRPALYSSLFICAAVPLRSSDTN